MTGVTMKLHCPDCGQMIPVEDVDLGSQLARCRACNSVFSFRGALDADRRGPDASPPLTPRPGRIRVEQRPDGVQIVLPWLRPHHVVVAIICVIWIGGVLAFLTIFNRAWRSPFDLTPLPGGPVWLSDGHVRVMPVGSGLPGGGYGFSLTSWLPYLLLLPGVGLAYWAVCGFVNRTVIRAGETLSIRHGPLPWPGNRRLPADQVRQLYVRRRSSYHYHRHHRRRGDVSYVDVDGPVVHTWFELRAVLADGSSLTLLPAIEDEEEALYLERAIESALGLENRPVRTEYAGA